MPRVLLLGGTTEASLLARHLATAGVDAVFSYAGRTDAPVAQPLPTRVGGFGGVAGLCAYLGAEGITHVIDATHPFAAGMSANAVAACEAAGVALLAFERAPWVAGPGDLWTHVADIAGAVAALPMAPARVFLAIGKQTLAAFAARPQHHYLIRLVDPPQGALPLADVAVEIARGPFTLDGDLALMKAHRITHIVAKNAGGTGARAKLDAARSLGLPVILIDRPPAPPRAVTDDPAEVLRWLGHSARLGV
ncbi:cobalt-precorrin-6A reductase [Aliigemmobacter aestuarii]|uniref:Cobalt-precorrin-6A reductase n=1 Tax=Aliigemmobacter aestuarii TaxID=1445661 RepID=A0A4V3V0N8_9RHOB|nr:cobalt-precorrin-6A reductase [Gemmobacter aestuarii]THD84732.1 cobalt-precorrin-6A reductase [Gemmobacter aestuarii]